MEQVLGIHFGESKGEHFFRSTLVQTLFYGVFSAWVLWCKKHPPTDTSAWFYLFREFSGQASRRSRG